MAYSHTVGTPTPQMDGCVHIVITETDVQTGSEWGPVRLPAFCELVAYRCDRSSGSTATRIDPVLGRAAGWSVTGANHLLTVEWGASETPRPFAQVLSTVPLMLGADGTLYGRTKPDGNGDSYRTELVVRVRDAAVRR